MIFHAHLDQSLLLATADECVKLVDGDLLDLVGTECVAANQVLYAAGCADRYLEMEQKGSGIFEHLVVATEQLLLLRQRRRGGGGSPGEHLTWTCFAERMSCWTDWPATKVSQKMPME